MMKTAKLKKTSDALCTIRGAISALTGQISEKDGVLTSHFYLSRQANLTAYHSNTFIQLTKELEQNRSNSTKALMKYHDNERFLKSTENTVFQTASPPNDLTDRDAVRSYRDKQGVLTAQKSKLEQRREQTHSEQLELLDQLTVLSRQYNDLLVQARELFVNANQSTERQMSAYTHGAVWVRRRFRSCTYPPLIINTTPEALFVDANEQLHNEVDRIISSAAIIRIKEE